MVGGQREEKGRGPEERSRAWEESQRICGLGTEVRGSKERKGRHIKLIGRKKCNRERGVDFSRFGKVTEWIWERLEDSKLLAVEIEAISMQVGPSQAPESERSRLKKETPFSSAPPYEKNSKGVSSSIKPQIYRDGGGWRRKGRKGEFLECWCV